MIPGGKRIQGRENEREEKERGGSVVLNLQFKKGEVIDAGTPPTDPLYDASHPDETTPYQQ